jgi:hypothetical protein
MNKIEEQFLLAIRLHALWEEQWLQIRIFPNYEVSSQGRVRKFKRSRILKQTTNCQGYRTISLVNNGKSKPQRVHRLNCSAFKLNPHGKPYIDHIDNNVSNNYIDNLRWTSILNNRFG